VEIKVVTSPNTEKVFQDKKEDDVDISKKQAKMNKLDRGVLLALAIVMGCVLVKTALDAAASLFLPAVIVGAGYGGYRAWQVGIFQKWVRYRSDVLEIR
jgi:uncharacterized membrane protein